MGVFEAADASRFCRTDAMFEFLRAHALGREAGGVLWVVPVLAQDVGHLVNEGGRNGHVAVSSCASVARPARQRRPAGSTTAASLLRCHEPSIARLVTVRQDCGRGGRILALRHGGGATMRAGYDSQSSAIGACSRS